MSDVIICGSNPVFIAERIGCGEQIFDVDQLYRCTDCHVGFHRACALKHFGERSGHDERLHDMEGAVDKALKMVEERTRMLQQASLLAAVTRADLAVLQGRVSGSRCVVMCPALGCEREAGRKGFLHALDYTPITACDDHAVQCKGWPCTCPPLHAGPRG